MHKYVIVLDFMKMLIQNIIQGFFPPKKALKIYTGFGANYNKLSIVVFRVP